MRAEQHRARALHLRDTQTHTGIGRQARTHTSKQTPTTERLVSVLVSRTCRVGSAERERERELYVCVSVLRCAVPPTPRSCGPGSMSHTLLAASLRWCSLHTTACTRGSKNKQRDITPHTAQHTTHGTTPHKHLTQREHRKHIPRQTTTVRKRHQVGVLPSGCDTLVSQTAPSDTTHDIHIRGNEHITEIQMRFAHTKSGKLATTRVVEQRTAAA